MPIDYNQLAIPKGRTRQQVKGRKQRAERAVKQSVRAACVERDGFCAAGRLSRHVLGHGTCMCVGWSEWAHLKGHRRSQTRGQASDIRHTTKHSLMLCTRHHAMEEAGVLRVVYLSARGCDGPIRFEVKA
jgi:hypothetical protein